MTVIADKLAKAILIFVLILLPVYAFTPGWQGNLINPAMRVMIPNYYFSMFDWFKNENLSGRVAILPAANYWNWVNYRWGYQGSGFLQFGIPQPILDRDYDRWSPYNENYYWELSRAIYTKKSSEVDAVLAKYDISYILLDSSVITRDSDRSLYMEELKTLLVSLPDYQATKQFGTIMMYAKNSPTAKQRTLFAPPSVAPTYSWTDNDVAYKELGSYINSPNNVQIGSGVTYMYPFRSLFTKRDDTNQFLVSEDDQTIRIDSLVNQNSSTEETVDKQDARVLSFDAPSLAQKEAFKPCGNAQGGTATLQNVSNDYVRLTSINQLACLSFMANQLAHTQGYIVAINHRNVGGESLALTILNSSAKHVEIETFLPKSISWRTTYLILPPLSDDGMGYQIFVSNNSIGEALTENDIKSITFYLLPYQKMITSSRVVPGDSQHTTYVLMSSESFHEGWLAYQVPRPSNYVMQMLEQWFPFFFGIPLPNHIKVNNWANGWIVDSNDKTIVTYFLPQLLEYVGFGILGATLLYIMKRK